jgi:protein prenyltransferase alpha subunit repeat containing protein 1
MSRALDKVTAATVKSGDLQVVYDDLVKALCPTTTDLLEIEILGRSHQLPPGCNVLVDGCNVAVPKATLVQAFMVARETLFRYLPDLPNRQQEIRNAAAVILLMDPEHITAANARKRVVQLYRTQPASELEAELRRELWWVDSMLTARLHRHTKSPTLWGHRRWVLEVCRTLKMPRDIHRDLTSVVLIAAERHPRNYYAWLHMRWLVQNVHTQAETTPLDGPRLLSTVKAWCLRHPGDTSSFSFLLFCLEDQDVTGGRTRAEASSFICREVLDLAVSFKWAHESVWVFLRTLVASGVAAEERSVFFEGIQAILAAGGSPHTQSTLQAAHDWCVEYEPRSLP